MVSIRLHSMAAFTLDQLCSDLKRTAGEIRTDIRSRTDATAVLDKLWYVQDQLHRLVAHVSDTSSTEDAVSNACPNLFPAVIDVLKTVAFHKLDRLPALAQACEHINNHLMELERIKENQQSHSAAARA
jgi:hypothetical protein